MNYAAAFVYLVPIVLALMAIYLTIKGHVIIGLVLVTIACFPSCSESIDKQERRPKEPIYHPTGSNT